MARRGTDLRPALRGFYVIIGIGIGAFVNVATSGHRWAFIPLAVLSVLAIAYEVYAYLSERTTGPADPVWEFAEGRLPYVGLTAMTMADAGVFFGHSIERRSMLSRLEAKHADPADRFIPVMGPSGVGKSSLVRAGVLPVLARRPQWILVPEFSPGRHPFEALAKSLDEALPGIGSVDLAQRLRTEPGMLAECLARLRTERNRRSGRVLLVIDQAEELLGAEMAQERENFLRVLREAVRADPGLWLIGLVRSEFLTPILQSTFGSLLRNPVNVAALSPEELQEVVRGPARRAGVTFAPDNLVFTLVADTGGGAALPHLAYVLNKLYVESDDFTITREDYERIGGVAGAVADAAEAAYDSLGPRRDAVLPVLLRFVTRSEEGALLGQPVPASTLSDLERELLQPFVDARLIVGSDAEAPAYQVAHEAFLTSWPRLVQEIDVVGEFLRRRDDLERWASDWSRMGRRDAYLISEERLAEIERWLEQRPDLVPRTEPIAEFLRRSRRLSDMAMKRLAASVAERALARVTDDPDYALAAAVEAVRCADTSPARRALVAALNAARTRAVLTGHTDHVENVAWSPTGSVIATVSSDGTARLWSVTDRAQSAPALPHGDVVFGLAWAPDGSRFVTASLDGRARIWSADGAGAPLVLEGAGDQLWNAAWSPDGAQVAAACNNGTVLLWNAGEPAPALVLRGHEAVAWGVDFSPDGRHVVTGARDGTARIWDRTTGGELLRLTGHEGWVHNVAYSPDGSLVASTSLDQTVRIWDTATGRAVAVLVGHGDTTQGLSWSRDGRWLATGSFDATIRVWSTETWRETAVLRGHKEAAMAVSWSDDSRYLVTGSWDGTVRIWDAFADGSLAARRALPDWAQSLAWAPGGDRLAVGVKDGTVHLLHGSDLRTLSVLSGHASWVHGVAWSPDGTLLATGSMDSTARVWDVLTGEVLTVLDAETARPVWGVAFSPDSARVATASHDFTVRLWEARTGAEQRVLRGHRGFVHTVAFSPDGTRVASGSEDGTVRIWDAATGDLVAVASGHRAGVRTVAYSPDGLRLASGSDDQTLRVWEASTGRLLHEMRAAAGSAQCVAWSRNGDRLAGGYNDGGVRLWDPQTAVEVFTLGVHDGPVASVAFTPDGGRIASSSDDGSVRLWNATGDMASLLHIAEARIFTPLTDDDRQALLLPPAR
ncbi:translocation protein TolB [Actinomadura rubteroloni]|uniref:Translocation protein TolB n=1 Tax=Actinomadura rubteroloni TaxID=1926885 RepID=A0A2P4UP03_9ACTN|nr:AAA family ATPase [Actinomadura rubteroloni]POM26762.1 translocation protein TolB [Actinomadura rubteroloni]